MLGLLITLLIIVGLSFSLLTISYMRTRDVVAAKQEGDAMTEIQNKQAMSLVLHIVAILTIVGYIGYLV